MPVAVPKGIPLEVPHTTKCVRQTVKCVRHFRALADWLAETPADRVAEKRAKRTSCSIAFGITFAVYGDEAGAERLIRSTPSARHPEAEWNKLAAGLVQRVSALTASCTTSTRAEILRRALIRPEQVLTNELYSGGDARPRPAQPVYSHIAGIDSCARGRQVLRAGGQPANALRRVVHAREPQK